MNAVIVTVLFGWQCGGGDGVNGNDDLTNKMQKTNATRSMLLAHVPHFICAELSPVPYVSWD